MDEARTGNFPDARRRVAIGFLLVIDLLLARPVISNAAPAGLRQPALSPDGAVLAFVYEGDLWRVDSGGGAATPLVTSQGDERRPVFSPDGRSIVFASRRDGDYDLYVVPAEGGTERRLTWAEEDDWPSGFTPDGAAVIFHSRRASETSRIFRLPIAGGEPEAITAAESYDGAVSPDGQTLAFTSGRLPWWRTNARGPAAQRLYAVRLGERPARPLAAGEEQQLWPQWLPDGRLLFVSSESVVANLWILDPRDGTRTLLTDHTDEAVRFPSLAADGSRVAYEHRGEIRLRKLRGKDRASRVVPITVAASSAVGPADTVRVRDWVDRLVPDGERRRLAVEARGEILLIDLGALAGGSDRLQSVASHRRGGAGGGGSLTVNLTNSSWREAAAAFAPDGSRLVFTGDANGHRDLWALSLRPDSAGRFPEPVRLRETQGEAARPVFSPDGRLLAYVRESDRERLMLADADGGRERPLLSASKVGDFAFRPDGLWLACVREDPRGQADLVVCSIYGDREVPLTDDAAIEAQPAWSPDGRRLIFRTVRGGETALWSVSFEGSGGSLGLAMGPVRLAGPSEGIGPYAFCGPLMEDLLVATTEDGGAIWRGTATGDAWQRVARTSSKPVELLLITKGQEAFCRLESGEVLRIDWNLSEVTPLPLDGEIVVDRRGEFRQLFREAWQILQSRFYDPAMHLRDWEGIRDRYQPRLAACRTAEETRELVLMMVGELDASHANLELPPWLSRSKGGDLGIDVRSGRDGEPRVMRIVPGGPVGSPAPTAADLWTPRIGDRLLAIDGIPVGRGCPIESVLAGTAGRDLRVEFEARSGGRRTTMLRAISGRQRERLEAEAIDAARSARVSREARGRIAYVHLRGIDEQAAARIEEALDPSEGAPPEGLVLDLRENLGGYGMDAVLSVLSRRPLATLRRRAYDDRPYPAGSWEGRVVAVIDASTASAAELVALGLRRHRLGTLVGAATYGGVLGAREHRMIDGSRFQSPEAGWYRLEGAALENRGVEPDVRVENRFGFRVDEDSQLTEAIRLARGGRAAVKPPLE